MEEYYRRQGACEI